MTRFPLIAAAILAAPAALAQTPDAHGNHDMAGHDMAGHDMSGHDMSGHDMAGMKMDDHAMGSALGDYRSARDASGTSWKPDASPHDMGEMKMSGDWMLMGHATLDVVYSKQDGPRGDDKTYLAGMFMGMAQRSFLNGDTLQVRGMLSPDPLMGKRGYPLLLAAGETADGVETLVDRQHPHDLFMELSVSYSKLVGEGTSVFGYVGLPGEPAFGPPAFMHRPAAEMSPEAPITHHWLDSTHITFGVVTAGLVHKNLKLEASRFRGREPDQDRYDIETGDLDSTALRVSWNPTDNLALQASWADVKSPEQLEPDVDDTKWSASALYSGPLGGGDLSLTGAWGRKERSDGVSLDAWLGEAAWTRSRWTLFGRAEAIETDELGGHHGDVHKAKKISVGLMRAWPLGHGVTFGVGGLIARNFTDAGLDPLYGGDPWGGMGFVRLKLGG